jgi:hypothetical protein
MPRLINNLPFILPALVLVGVLGYAFWFRDLPQAEGRITGDYAAASELAAEGGIPLYLAVDLSPY